MPARRRKIARPTVSIDFGSYSVRLATASAVKSVPSIIAFTIRAGRMELVAWGKEALRMQGKTPAGVKVIRPVVGSQIADPMGAAALLRCLMKDTLGLSLRRPKVMLAVPTNTNAMAQQALVDAAKQGGAGEVVLVPSVLGAALGASLPVTEAVGGLVVDAGCGLTHIAVASLGGLVVDERTPVAGAQFDRAIAQWLLHTHDLAVSERTTEALKKEIGSVMPSRQPAMMRVRGRVRSTGRALEVDVTSKQLVGVLKPGAAAIRDTLFSVLRQTPPMLSADILQRGLVLCGGSSGLRGLAVRLREDTGLSVVIPENPSLSVILGLQQIQEDQELFERASQLL